jgi:hypothetical protein
MKPNTLIKLPDGRVGRTVYHNLDGYGIKFGTQMHDPENLPEPDAMLRKPWRDDHEYEMVGEDYERVDELDADSPNEKLTDAVGE